MPGNLLTEIDKGLIRFSFVVVILLILVNIVFVFFPAEVYRSRRLEEPIRTVVRQLDLKREENVATWCTTALLLLNALFAYNLRRQFQHTDPVAARYLGLFSIGFLLLSVDDLAQFHEKLEGLLEDALEATHVLDHIKTGIIFGSLLALLLALLTYRGLSRHLRRTDKALLAVSVFWILFSVASELVPTHRPSVARRLEILGQEGGELLALVFFLTFQYHVFAHQRSLRTSSSSEVDGLSGP